MKMPASVIVGPYDIPIRELDPSAAEKDFGHFDSEKMEIRLRKEFATPAQAADVFLHELLHAIWSISGMDAEKDDEERLVSTLSTQLCAVIRQNTGILPYLQEALKK